MQLWVPGYANNILAYSQRISHTFFQHLAKYAKIRAKPKKKQLGKVT
jgi:hypothetical protein